MEIVLHDNNGKAVVCQTVAGAAKRIDFPAVDRDVVIAGYTLDGVKHAVYEPVMVHAGQIPRLKLWR